jgi:hypothetical protein
MKKNSFAGPLECLFIDAYSEIGKERYKHDLSEGLRRIVYREAAPVSTITNVEIIKL